MSVRPHRSTRFRPRPPLLGVSLEAATLIGFTVFFLLYGLVPWFGGDSLGLVGADEPRYAQIAHEMLIRFEHGHSVRERLLACVTPFLYGRPWLEKPALYYWRAMFAFKEFGFHDWSARLPSASFAFVLVLLGFLHIRRFRPGGQLDAALITVTSVGILSFARGASTDMQLAAPFCIGMLGWYAWYETDSKFWLFDLYFFVGAATLAKGPVAPFMALAILVAFAALRREWSILRRSVWIPGILLYLAMVLPWFLAVQHYNPTFFQQFFLEHNLERFATERYQHIQPFWYYLPIMLLALTPWTVLCLQAALDGIRQSVGEWRALRRRDRCGSRNPGDAFPEFLVVWALFPILFFSLSQSKLPGYILPAVPPITILTGDYLNRVAARGLPRWLLGAHALFVGLMMFVVLLGRRGAGRGRELPPRRFVVAALMAGLAAVLLILVMVLRFGVRRLRVATLVPMGALLLFLFGVGPFFGSGEVAGSKQNVRLLDAVYSARPLANILAGMFPPGEPVATYRARRDLQYGLAFYRKHEVAGYDDEGVPLIAAAHILVVREPTKGEPTLQQLGRRLAGRRYQLVFAYPPQNLLIYEVLSADEVTSETQAAPAARQPAAPLR
jgi:4-amino-4-deoxy-L-arabinose transferase-like glycosyltransferase